MPLAVAGLAGAIYFLNMLRGSFSPIMMDYVVWATFIAAMLAALGDIRRHCRSAGYASTLTMDILAVVFLMIGRGGSTAYSLWNTSLATPIVGGSTIFNASVALASLVALGSIWLSLSVVMHCAFEHPIVLRATESYCATLGSMKGASMRLLAAIEKRPVLFAFAIGFGIRLIPEVVWWPWPIGWDTFEYMAELNDFLAFPNPLSPDFNYTLSRTPPLLNTILSLPGALFGSWAVFKAFPPIAYGAIIALVAFTSKRALQMNNRQALLAAVVSAFFILNLRMSSDYQKQILGTIMLMAALVCIREDGGWKRNLGVASLFIMAALASQITAVAAVPAILLLLVDSARLRRLPRCALYASSLIIVIAALAQYSGGFVWGNSTFGLAPAGVYSLTTSASSALIAYTMAGYTIILVPALLVFRSYNKYYLAVIAALLVAGLSPIFVPYTSISGYYRFLIEIVPFAVPLAIKGMLTANRRLPVAAYSLAIILIGCCFIFPGGSTYTGKLTNTYIEFPVSVAPDPASRDQLTSLIQFSSNISNMGLDEGIPIIVPYYLYRYVHYGILNPAPGRIISLNTADSYTLNRSIASLNASTVYFFADISEQGMAKMLDSMSYNSTGGLVTFSFTILRDGMFCFYEVSRSFG